jgi:molecular chaperone DnaJ
MNIQEAYSTLDVKEGISDTELKSIYKSLAKKYHPDVYKEDTSRFSKINEAYQLITDYRKNPEKYNPPASPFGGGFSGFNININDILNGGFNRSQRQEADVQPINLNTKISFKESVLGVEKELTYKKKIKCDGCNGNGKEMISNGCKSCNGFGRVIQQQNNSTYTSGCNKCHGRNIQSKDCIKCKTKGCKEIEVNVKINIPPGNATTLRIQGAGNYAGSSFLGDAYSDVFLTVNVETDPDLTLIGTDVVYNLKLPLVDAITGCKKEIRTIYDTRTIIVPAKSKNREEVIIDGCGIKQARGNQRVILNVEYPDDIDGLVEFLKKESE